MNLFARLFGSSKSGASVHDPSGPFVLMARDSGDALSATMRGRARSTVALGHDEPELLDRLAALHPALVVLQVESNGTNGFSIAKRIKSDSRLRLVPLVLFSQEVDEETFAQHRKLRTRADAYVSSSDPTAIKAALEGLVSSL